MVTWLAACALKASLLVLASWLGARLVRTAAARHQMWTLGIVGALALPIVCCIVPSWSPPTAPSTVRIAWSIAAGGEAPIATSAWPMWLAIAWAAGTIVVALRSLRGHLVARRLVRTSTPLESAMTRAAARSVGLVRTVRLARSVDIGTPMTIGILRPYVLLPAAADAWSPARLHAVLVHELGHVRRRDTAVQLVAQLACAVYWWNPLVWLAAARLRIEREHACDDLVLRAGVVPSSYATDLLDVARSLSRDHAVGICMVDRSHTETRLRRILDDRMPRGTLRIQSTLALTAVALASVVAIACTSSPPPSAPTARGVLSVGAPSVRNPVMFAAPVAQPDLSLVAAEVANRIGSLEQCYERRLAVTPTLAGTVVIHWVIDDGGSVVEACITEDTVRDREIVDCVNALVSAGPFAPPRGGAVDVTVPFVFAAAKS